MWGEERRPSVDPSTNCSGKSGPNAPSSSSSSSLCWMPKRHCTVRSPEQEKRSAGSERPGGAISIKMGCIGTGDYLFDCNAKCKDSDSALQVAVFNAGNSCWLNFTVAPKTFFYTLKNLHNISHMSKYFMSHDSVPVKFELCLAICNLPSILSAPILYKIRIMPRSNSLYCHSRQEFVSHQS